MSVKETPYIIECPFCGNGLLRAHRCGNCQSVTAICDECELMWPNVEQIFNDPKQKASSAFPKCCHCDIEDARWEKLDETGIARAGLEAFITDSSA